MHTFILLSENRRVFIKWHWVLPGVLWVIMGAFQMRPGEIPQLREGSGSA